MFHILRPFLFCSLEGKPDVSGEERKISEYSLQVNETSASADDLAASPSKKNSLVENKKLLVEQQLGAAGKASKQCQMKCLLVYKAKLNLN